MVSSTYLMWLQIDILLRKFCSLVSWVVDPWELLQAVQNLIDEEFQGIVHLRTSTLHKKVASARHDFIKLSGSENKLEALLQVQCCAPYMIYFVFFFVYQLVTILYKDKKLIIAMCSNTILCYLSCEEHLQFIVWYSYDRCFCMYPIWNMKSSLVRLFIWTRKGIC